MSRFNVTPNGVITVDTVDIKSEFEEAYKGALGADLDLDASTPQGQMIINDTAAYVQMQQEIVNIANNYSVFYASGHALDVAGSRYGYYRKQGTSTVVVATVHGAAGTTIPAGSLASDGTNEYAALDTVTLDAQGAANIQFQCTLPGNIECSAGALNTIVTPITGWDSVSNTYDGVPGYDTESDNIFRERITANMLQKRARSALGAIVDNIAAIPNVVSAVGRENVADSTATIDGIEMAPHSIYLAILGGDDKTIARVIAQQKTLGAATNGNTIVSYLDNDIGYTYQYKIQRPAQVELRILVTYTNTLYTPVDAQSRMQSLIMEYVAANPFKIGQTITGADLANALKTYDVVDLLSVEVAINSSRYTPYVRTTLTEIAGLTAANITFSKQ